MKDYTWRQILAGLAMVIAGSLVIGCGSGSGCQPKAIDLQAECQRASWSWIANACVPWTEGSSCARYPNDPRCAVLYDIFSVVRPAAPAAGCLPIDFGRAPSATMITFDSTATTAYAASLYRQADGTFAAQGFSSPVSNTPTFTKVGTMAQAQAAFAGCSAASPWTPKPHPTLMADLPGAMSRGYLAANLGGTPYAEIRVDSQNQNNILVTLDTQNTMSNSPSDYPVGANPVGILTADFNGDGKSDVAVVNAGASGAAGSVSILLGNGNGTLRPAVNYNVGKGAYAMAALDFNHDGRPDLAVSNYTDNTITILLANANGSMSTAHTYALPGTGVGSAAMVAADFDGDGKADLMAYSPQGFLLLRGNGDGSFQAPKTAAGVPNYSPIYLVAGDFNKDGKPDIATQNQDGTVAILWNAGDGTLSTHARYVVGTPLSSGLYMPSMFAMDFNDDGNLDLVVANGHPDALFPNPEFITVLLGNGDGSFQGAAMAYDAGYGPTAMAMADFNGDGLRDLVVAVPGSNPDATGASTMRILLGQSGGGFQAPKELAADTSSMTWVTAADLNGDGHADLVGVDAKGLAHVWLGNGDGTFQSGTTYPAGTAPTFVTAGDVNGDGRPDLVIAYGNGNLTSGAASSVSLLTAKSGGGFNAAISIPTGANTLQVLLDDINGDGKLDLIAANLGYPGADTPVAGNVTVSLGKGDGTFQAPATYSVGLDPTSLAAADWTGDGKLDLIVGTTTSAGAQIAVLKGNGSGTFGAATFFSTYSVPLSLTAADFDGDGKLDLGIVDAASDSPMTIMKGNGDGTFQPEYPVLTGDSPITAIAADFTGDGRPDLAVLDQTSGLGSVALFRNTSAVGACTYSLSASGTAQPVAMAGGAGSFNVIAGTGCDWTAAASADWIRLAFPTWGSNNGTVKFTALANTGATRIGSVTVGGKTYTITQTGTGAAQWTITKSHAGNFTQGQNGATYTIRVGNSGTAASSGTVTATENVPAGLTLASMAGQGWTCPAGGNTCTRSDALNTGANFPDLSVTVNVSASAAASLTNQASVAGGGAGASAAASDSTTIAPAGSGGTPLAVSVSPAAGSWAYASYTFTFSDSAGWQNISVADVLINNFVNGIGACYVAVAPASSSVFLVDDAGDAGGPYQGMVLPGAGTVQNSQCSISGTGSSIAGSGNTLTVTLAISFTASFAGNKVMYLAARESGGANSGWQALGTCGVPGGSTTGPAVSGVTPGRSSGPGAQTLTFTFTDTNGWQDLGVVNVLINDALNGNQACYLAYSRQYNTLYLVNDTGNALLAGLTLNGTAGTGNRQCTVSGAGSSASGSGNTLTLTLNMSFPAAFAGNRIIYAAARSNGDLLNSGWQAVGSRTVE